MSIPTFAARKKAWSAPPVDDIGYIPAKDLLGMDDKMFSRMMRNFWTNRYEGWRNFEGRWVEMFELNELTNSCVLEYGCGVGMDAAQYADLGNRVWVADIAPDNLKVARRLFGLYNTEPEGELLITEKKPFLTPPVQLDVIHCVGVLHHIPNPEPVVEAMADWLVDGGHLHLMLYSDVAWRIATGTHPPPGRVEDSPRFEAFWQHWDPIGGYADWYSKERIRDRFGHVFAIDQCGALTEHGEYIGAVLVKK